MTEQSIFVYKLFLLLIIPDFSLFLSKNCTRPPPPEKKAPLSLVRGSAPPSPPADRGGGAHYDETTLLKQRQFVLNAPF